MPEPVAARLHRTWGLRCADEADVALWLGVPLDGRTHAVNDLALSANPHRKLFCRDAEASFCAAMDAEGRCVVAELKRKKSA